MIVRFLRLLPTRTGQALSEMVGLLVRYRRLLVATTRIEFAKRYAGSVFGLAWVALQPLLFLGVYLFVYLVVFKVRFPGYSELDYVLYVFAGLVPYIGFMECLSQGTLSIKQNIHLVKNVMVPIDLIPVRVVLMALVTQLVGFAMVLILSAVNGAVAVNLLFFPVAMVVQALFLLGLVWVFAALGVLFMDIAYFVNIFLLLLLFLSPIAFRPDMLSPAMHFLVDWNPIYYMTELYRFSLIGTQPWNEWVMGIAVVGSVATFILGALFFRQFKNLLVDYE